jgi:hypothetical protein
MKGHLSGLGYEQKAHDQMIAEITVTDIPEIVVAICAVYKRLYDQNPYEINCGNCEEFAADLIAVCGKGNMFWHDEMEDCTTEEEKWWAHCFVEVDGRFYDAECPNGVDNWRQIPCFVNNTP